MRIHFSAPIIDVFKKSLCTYENTPKKWNPASLLKIKS